MAQVGPHDAIGALPALPTVGGAVHEAPSIGAHSAVAGEQALAACTEADTGDDHVVMIDPRGCFALPFGARILVGHAAAHGLAQTVVHMVAHQVVLGEEAVRAIGAVRSDALCNAVGVAGDVHQLHPLWGHGAGEVAGLVVVVQGVVVLLIAEGHGEVLVGTQTGLGVLRSNVAGVLL